MTSEAVIDNQTAAHDAEADSVDSTKAFGFWIYLMSDGIIFAILFATYTVLDQRYAGGPTGKDLFELGHTFWETLLLLTSSTTYGLVTLGLQESNRRKVLLGLGITFFLGLGFIIMELSEFHHMISIGAGPQRSAFLSAFFTLVGTHGLHVTLGLIWILVMMTQVLVKGLTSPVHSKLLRLSMFWHFLDIIWIGIFTIVYLLGVL